MNIAEGLTHAKAEGVDLLDAELLLAEVLLVQREFILAHPEEILTPAQQEQFEDWISRCAQNEPLAYLLGVKEFFGRDFVVNKNVLVPRPETEELVEWVLRKAQQTSGQLYILDVGTGSGAIACTLAAELPQSEVVASDVAEKVLDVARSNAKELGLSNITFTKSNLLEDIKPERPFDVVVANLPYLDEGWAKDPSTIHEPNKALYAKNNGLALYEALAHDLPQIIHNDSFGIFEADPRNAVDLQKIIQQSLPKHAVTLLNDSAQRERFVTFEKKR